MMKRDRVETVWWSFEHFTLLYRESECREYGEYRESIYHARPRACVCMCVRVCIASGALRSISTARPQLSELDLCRPGSGVFVETSFKTPGIFTTPSGDLADYMTVEKVEDPIDEMPMYAEPEDTGSVAIFIPLMTVT